MRFFIGALISCTVFFGILRAEEASTPDNFFILNESLGSLAKNTLVELISSSDSNVSIRVYKHQFSEGKHVRIPLFETSVKKTDFFKAAKPAELDVGPNREAVMLHPTRKDDRGNRREDIIYSDSETALFCPPPNAAENLETQVNEIFETAAQQNPSLPQESVRAQIEDDLDWFFNFIQKNMTPDMESKIQEGLKAPSKRSISGAEIASAQRQVIRQALQAMSSEPRFQGEAGKLRASWLMSSLTLYGEFRRRDSPDRRRPVVHRSLPHLFWAYQTMKNRLDKAYWGNQVNRINPSYDPTGNLSESFSDSLVPVVLSAYQYSAWNPGDSNLSAILTSQYDDPAYRDIADVIAGIETGVIKMDEGKPNPMITHYISPGSLVNGVPEHWKKRSFTRFSPEELPRVIRKDQPNKNSVDSAPEGTFEYLVNPVWFEGAREER